MQLREQQKVQYEHDLRNHFDILSLSRADRLKHYGLHFAKYAGRLARGTAEVKSRSDTLVDAFLVSLSTANALNQELRYRSHLVEEHPSDVSFTDFAGRFADACEKIDHLEEFRPIALNANELIVSWIFVSAEVQEIDLLNLAEERRDYLAQRAFYAERR